MKMKGSRIIVESLLQEKVDTVFCYTGGAVISLFDALGTYGKSIGCIQPRHEQAGTHAADAYARSTGKTGVVIVTSGPGATNTVTGIATAYMDSVPLVVITGQVPTSKIGSDAFQEADVTGMTLPMTKAGFLVRNAAQLAGTLKKAFHLARTGRPGPVVVDIPADVQNQVTEWDYPAEPGIKNYSPKTEAHPKQIKTAIQMINKAKKPLVIAGGGVIFSGSAPLLNHFLDLFQIPAVNTLMGYGINPTDPRLYYGGIGMHGSLYGNYAVQNADLIIALGVRFSDRITGDTKSFAPNARIIQVDIDPAEIGKNVPVDLPVTGTVRSFLEKLNRNSPPRDYSPWVNELMDYKTSHPMGYKQGQRLKPQHLIETAGRLFPDDTIVATDVGQHQMWVAQYFHFTRPRTLLSSSGLGTMGYALPAAIGAAVGNPGKPVLMIAGDGGFQMNLQELATIKKYGLNIKMLILDNGYLGMVRQWQELMFDSRYIGTEMNDNPDFARLAQAFGIKALTLSSSQGVADCFKQLLEAKESMLVHALVEGEDNVLPMVPAGQSLDRVITSFNK